MKCAANCASGYRYDDKGCRTCECVDGVTLEPCGTVNCEVGQICRNKTIKYIDTPVCIAKPLCYVMREKRGLPSGRSMSARGVSTPECEASGAFKPLQCDLQQGDCWCVDDRGVEIDYSRTIVHVGGHKPACDRNLTVALNMRMVLVRTSAFSEADDIDEAELTRVLPERVADWMRFERQYLTVLHVNHEDDRFVVKILAHYNSRADLPSSSDHLKRWANLDRCRVFLDNGVTLRLDPVTLDVEHKFSLTPVPIRPALHEIESGVYVEQTGWWPGCFNNKFVFYTAVVTICLCVLAIVLVSVIHARRRRAHRRLNFEHARLASQCSTSSEKCLLGGEGAMHVDGGKEDGVHLISAGRINEKTAIA
jgi:hypothetical protein